MYVCMYVFHVCLVVRMYILCVFIIIQVCYIDYGNCETIPVDSVIVQPACLEVPAMSISILLANMVSLCTAHMRVYTTAELDFGTIFTV